MKKTFVWVVMVAVVVLAAATLVSAGPFLKSQPQTGVSSYTITGDTYFSGSYTPQGDGSLKVDLAGVPSGPHTVVVNTCNLWECVSSDPFIFTKTPPAKAVISIGAN